MRERDDRDHLDFSRRERGKAGSGGRSGRHDVVHEHDAAKSNVTAYGERAEGIVGPCFPSESGLVSHLTPSFEKGRCERCARVPRELARDERRLVESALDEPSAVERHGDEGISFPEPDAAHGFEEQARKWTGKVGPGFVLQASDRGGEWRRVGAGREHWYVVDASFRRVRRRPARAAEHPAREGFLAAGAAGRSEQAEEKVGERASEFEHDRTSVSPSVRLLAWDAEELAHGKLVGGSELVAVELARRDPAKIGDVHRVGLAAL